MSTTPPRRNTPSSVDVDAAGVLALLDALEGTPGVEPHSLMLLRHGAVIAEGWWAPYSAERPHLLYSLSKSFTSAAVGFAVAEGLLDLDDTVLQHFPELDAEVTDPRSRALRIRHVLAMSSGHRAETIDRVEAIDPVDLVRGFLLLPPDEEPGSVFAYNQPCTFTAAAIVQRAAGMPLTEYLRPRLLDPLGIGTVGWLTDDAGRELGYSGLHATTSAVAALGQLLLDDGHWAGEELLAPEWIAEATRAHIGTGGEENVDWAQGYGFQFWRARQGYRGDGAYGQFCVVLPEHDVVLAMTGQSTDMQAVLDAVWTHLLPALGGAGSAEGSAEADAALEERLASLALPPLGGGVPDASPASAAAFTAAADNDQPGLTLVELAADGALTLVEGENRLEVVPGDGEWNVSGAIAASAARVGEHLAVDVIFVETPHRLHLVLDTAEAVFTAAWESVPLHGSPLARLRMPTPSR